MSTARQKGCSYMLLADLVQQYAELHEYGVSAGHQRQLLISVRAWSKQAGHAVTLADLTDERLNAYIDWMRQNRKPDTCRTRRGNLLILWHYAYQNGLAPEAPRRLRRLRPISRCPVAWTVAEVKRLVETAESLPGTFWKSPIRRSSWWSSLIRTAYDSGLRLGDLRAISPGAVQSLMAVIQQKTGNWVQVQLRPATLSAIDQTLADKPRPLVWELWGCEETFFLHLRKLVKLAGIRPGTFRWIRRASATAVESVEPGRATELLGHRSRAVTEAFYLDRSQLSHPPLPPW